MIVALASGSPACDLSSPGLVPISCVPCQFYDDPFVRFPPLHMSCVGVLVAALQADFRTRPPTCHAVAGVLLDAASAGTAFCAGPLIRVEECETLTWCLVSSPTSSALYRSYNVAGFAATAAGVTMQAHASTSPRLACALQGLSVGRPGLWFFP